IPPLFGGKGYLKKYLHLWRFEDTLDLSDGSISEMENHARFRFVHAQEKDILSLRKENGVVRIVTEPLKSERPENIYGQWLKIWNKGYPPALLLEEEGRPAALLALDTGHFKVFTADDFSRNDPDAQRLRKLAEANAASCILTIAHKADVVGKPDILRYRNHGSLRTQFWAGVDPNSNVNAFRHVAEHYPVRLPELFETLSTRICAFDNRLWQRVRKDIEDSKDKDGNIDKRLDFYRHKLKLVVHGESPTEHAGNKGWLQEWEEELITFIPDCHFLVLHLSFIERILEAKHLADPAYRAGNIGLFIDKELRPAIEQGGKIRDNFFLVVTTGRGRSEWLASLDGEDYRHFNRFTIFRPVESLISAVEHSLSIKDDIDLKFRLVKVLFGS
ncbi:MAG: hypothetical protein L6Q97_25745, partial [Thermoanaerobaculia bacterium]|nr:hypothetical protein [Thermoanaerobaculia bacterium]